MSVEGLREHGCGRGAGSKWVWVCVDVCGGWFGVCALGRGTMVYGLGAVSDSSVCMLTYARRGGGSGDARRHPSLLESEPSFQF